MVKKKDIQLSIIIILAILVIIFLVFNSKGTLSQISPEEFETLVNQETVFVINTHTPYVGEIDGTDLIAESWDNMELYRVELPKDKNTKIALYCRSGRMAETSAAQLIEMGYTKIYNLEGGMKAWESSGRDIILINIDRPIKS